MAKRILVAALILGITVPLGCDGELVEPEDPEANQLEILAGANQQARVTEALPNPLTVWVGDQNDDDYEGATVVWEIAGGGGSLSASTSTTGAGGLAQVEWTLGEDAGTATVRASVRGLTPVTFTATVLPGEPEDVRIMVSSFPPLAPVDPDLEEFTFVALGDSIAVQAEAEDAFGNALSAADVDWRNTAPSVATLLSGTVQASAPGSADIVATAGTATDTLHVAVAPEASALVVGPGVDTMTSRLGTAAFTAELADRNGNPLEGNISWSVSTAVLVLSDGTGQNVELTLAPDSATPDGRAEVIATHGSVADTADVVFRIAPMAPQNLASTVTGDTADLSWSDESDNESGFIVQRTGANSTSWETIDTAAANATSFRDTGVGFSSQYQHRVVAFNSYGEGIGAPVVTETGDPPVPQAPSGLAVDSASASSAWLRWTDNARYEEYFRISRRPDASSAWVVVDETPADSTAVEDTGLAAGTIYWYRIRSCNVTGCSAATDSVSVQTDFMWQLSVTQDGLGSMTSEPAGIGLAEGDTADTAVFADSTEVTLTASPADGWTLAAWGGACSHVTAATQTCTITIVADTLASVTYEPTLHQVIVDRVGRGAVVSDPEGIRLDSAISVDTATFAAGTEVTLTVAPDSGWTMFGWDGACSGTAPGDTTCVFTVGEDMAVTAELLASQPLELTVTPEAEQLVAEGDSVTYALSVTGHGDPLEGASIHVVDSLNNAVDTLVSAPDGSATYRTVAPVGSAGDTYELKFTATQPGWIPGPAQIRQVRVALDAVWTLALSQEGQGSVTSSPAGIALVEGDTAGSATFTDGAEVTLTASPAAGWMLASWGGACSEAGSDSTCVITMLADTTVSVHYVQDTYRLAVDRIGEGNVVSDPVGIALDSAVAADTALFGSGSDVTLSVTPDSGWSVHGWTGPCAGAGTDSMCVLTMTADTSVTVELRATQPLGLMVTPESEQVIVEGDSVTYALNVSGLGMAVENASVYVTDSLMTVIDTVVSAADGTASYTTTAPVGSAGGVYDVRFNAVKPGWVSSPAYIRQVRVASDTSWTLAVTQDGKGTLTSDPAGIAMAEGDTAGSATFADGTAVTLTASPADGWTLDSWGGACAAVDSDSTCVLTLVSDTAVSVTYASTTADSVPTPASGLSAMAGSDSSVTVSWTDGEREDLYQVYRRPDSADAWVLADTVPADTVSYLDTTLSAGTRCWFTVDACNGFGCVPSADTVSVATDSLPETPVDSVPGGPTTISAATVSSTSIEVSWNAADSTAAWFRVHRQPTADSSWTVAGDSLPTDTLVFIDDGLESSTEYAYFVEACNDAGCAPSADTVRATTLGAHAGYYLTASRTGSGSLESANGNLVLDSTTALDSAFYGAGATVTLTATPDTGWTVSAWGGVCEHLSRYVTTCTFDIGSDTTATVTFAEAVPTASTDSATDATASDATLHGTVTAPGVSTTAWFEWGIDSTALANSSGAQTVTDTAGSSISQLIEGLAGETKYFFRVAAESGADTARGALGTFTTPADSVIDLSSGVPLTDLSGASGSETLYRIVVPNGQDSLVVETSGGSGDVDLYVRYDTLPTSSVYDCRSYQSGNAESCDFASPDAGDWYIMLHGYSSYSVVTLTAEYGVGSTTLRTLSVSKSGSGTVSSSPSGISISATGSSDSYDFEDGTSVTLTANPSSGWQIAGWTGACNGTSSTCTVSMTADESVSVTFEETNADPTNTLTVTQTGSGSVSSDLSGISLSSPGTQAASYGAGTTVQLTASPASGWEVGSWGGECTGTSATCTVTLNSDLTVTVDFVETSYDLTVTQTGSGSVSSDLSGINLTSPGTQAAAYSAQATVALTASPASGWEIASWGGACSATSTNDDTCEVTMTGDRAASVTFEEIPNGRVEAELRGLDGSLAAAEGTRFSIDTSPERSVDGANPGAFSDVNPGEYRLRGFFEGTEFGAELWAQRSVRVESGVTAEVTLLRELPYAESVVFYNDDNGDRLSPGSSVATGTRLRAEITVRNASAAALDSRVRLLFDQDGAPPYEVDLESTPRSVGGDGQSIVFTFEFTPSAGVFARALTVTTEVDGNEFLTDSWDWSQALQVLDPPSVPVSIYGAFDVDGPAGVTQVDMGLWLFGGRPFNAPQEWTPIRDDWESIADWLNAPDPETGRRLLEPINVAWVDFLAESADEAEDGVRAFLEGCGFFEEGPNKHSAGYLALLGHTPEWFDQWNSSLDRVAFVDAEYPRANNHGRVFGPRALPGPNGGFLVVAAFSREDEWHKDSLNPLDWHGHEFLGFNVARDRLLDPNRCDNPQWDVERPLIALPNIMPRDRSANYTTAEHDGTKVFVRGVLPDLQVVSLIGANTGRGGTMRIQGQTVDANGIPSFASSGSTRVIRIYLSTSTDFSGEYYEICEVPRTSTGGFDVDCTVPSEVPAGEYFVLAFVDGHQQISETEEGNNLFPSADRYTISSLGPDLEATSLSVSPSTPEAGRSFTVAFTVTNTGDEPTGTWRWELGGTYNTGRDESSLAPGESFTDSFISTSLGAGTYQATVCADPDGLIAEQDENNNCRTLEFSVEEPTPPLPDLNPHSVSGPSQVSPGDEVTVSWNTENEGEADAPAGWSTEIVLSEDSRIGDSDDIRLGTTSWNSILRPNRETIESKRVQIPSWVEAGDYYYGVIADYRGEVEESSESDNDQRGNSVEVQGASAGQPDLVPTGGSAPSSASRGSTISVSVTTENQGSARTSGGFRIKVYLSNDYIFGDSDDVEICSETTYSELGIGSAWIANLNSCLIPSSISTGTYRLFSDVDTSNWIAESNESNNHDLFDSIVIN